MTHVIRNLHRSRVYIDALRSGQRWIDACAATVAFHPLLAGDHLHIVNAKTKHLELVCEIARKTHYKSIAELVEGEDVARCLGVAAKASGKAGHDRDANAVKVMNTHGKTVAAHEFEQSGVFALHLHVLEDMSCEDEHEYRVLHLQELQQIERGEKTIAARISFKVAKRIVCPGDRLNFIYNGDPHTSANWQLTCEAIAIKQYPTFRDLLLAEGIDRCMPGGVDLKRAIKMCHTQQQNASSRLWEQERGVIAIHLKPISALRKVDASGEAKELQS